MSLFGYLAILAGVGILVFGTLFYAFSQRIMRRESAPISEEIGGAAKVLNKLRRGEPMSNDELDYARQVIADRSSPMAFSIPATVFSLGCFYVFGNLELHGIHSLRIYIGLGPMLGSISLTIRLLRTASLKRRLRNVAPVDQSAHAGRQPVS